MSQLNDPMQIRLALLKQVVEVCLSMQVRAKDSGSLSWRGYFASGFFAKATLHGQSICFLLQGYKDGRIELDVGGVCALSRCIMEVHNASSYLFESKIAKEEAELRHQLFLLNHATDLKKISAGFGILNSDDRLSIQEFSRRWSESEIAKNPIFQNLDEAQKKKILKGRSPYLTDTYKGRKLLEKPVESAAYNLFSHSVHSFSLGLSPGTRGQYTPAGEFHMVFLAVEMALMHLGTTALDYWRLRSRAIKKLSAEDKLLLKGAASGGVLKDWLRNMAAGGTF